MSPWMTISKRETRRKGAYGLDAHRNARLGSANRMVLEEFDARVYY